MITVEITMLPAGDPEKAYTLGLIALANDGTGDEHRGNYTVAISHCNPLRKTTDPVWKKTHVNNFNRDDTVYTLIRKALQNAGF